MTGVALLRNWCARFAPTVVVLICLLSAAIWNGYPIVYSDTSSYLVSGFHLETLIDRPITYGLFIRVCSFNGWSLWTVVIAQSLLLGHVVGRALLSIGFRNPWVRSGIIGTAALLTGLPFVCGQLITDVFTPTLLFTLYLLLFCQDLARGERVRFAAIFLLVFAMHMSHIALTILLLVVAFIQQWRSKNPFSAKHWWANMGMVLALAIVGTLAMGVALAKSKNTFFAASMAGSGILQRYLQEHCATEHYHLCAYIDQIPRSADAFLWGDNTVLNTFSDRQQMNAELGAIVRGSFREPTFIGMHITSALSASAEQLTRFAVGDGNGDFHQGTQLYERVALFIPSEIRAFNSSRQMQVEAFQGPLRTANWFYNFMMLAGLLVVGVIRIFFWSRLRNKPYMGPFILFLLIGFVVTASSNASLVMVADRFGTKLAWIVPFIALVLLVKLCIPKRTEPVGE